MDDARRTLRRTRNVPVVHREARGEEAASWLLASSPFDSLVHAAKQSIYFTSGEPAISLACGPWAQSPKLSRVRYEIMEGVITCLACLAIVDEAT